MSYILEALKKAQAERQLGSAPTIHAVPITAAPVVTSASARTPLWIAAAVAATLAAVAAVMWWRGPEPVAPAVLAVPPIVAEAPVVAVVPPVALPALPAPPSPPAPVPQAAPGAPSAAPVAAPAKKPALAAPPAAPVIAAEPEPVVPPAPEENLPFLSQLPEPQRSEAPKVSFGGYMYSKNPADRMLIVDKVLRREGEEVAPGLILEQLQPKAAVLNYRGTRYRMAY